MNLNTQDNAIEWVLGDKQATVTFSQRKYIGKIKRLAKKFPEDVKIVFENADGSIVAHIPVSAVKISIIKRDKSEETDEDI